MGCFVGFAFGGSGGVAVFESCITSRLSASSSFLGGGAVVSIARSFSWTAGESIGDQWLLFGYAKNAFGFLDE